MVSKEEVVKSLDKLLNRFLFQSKKFVECSAFPYGLLDIAAYGKKSTKLTYDFEYFVFTKSTKTLKAIRELLKKGFNEDVFILVRSIFENYLSCRYLHENEDKIDEFIANPLNISLAHFNVISGEIYDKEKVKIGKITNTNEFKIGMDKRYYYDFYDILSRFTHCNFGVIESYVDNNSLFTIDEVGNEVLSRLCAVFVFTKLFELVVTVEGEEFIDNRTEKNCYKLVDDSLAIQSTVFDLCIQELSNANVDLYKFKNRRMIKMLRNMKKSLLEELGSVRKGV